MSNLHPLVTNEQVFNRTFVKNRIADAIYKFKNIVEIKEALAEDHNPDLTNHLREAFKGDQCIYWWMDLRTLDMVLMTSRDKVPDESIYHNKTIYVGYSTDEDNIHVAF